MGETYIKIRDGVVAKTREVSPECFVDFDSGGKLIGIELLAAPLPAPVIPDPLDNLWQQPVKVPPQWSVFGETQRA